MIKMKSNNIMAIDIGSSKIRTLIAELDEGGIEPIILGYSNTPSKGVKKGVIINIEEATKSITQSINTAMEMTDIIPENCFVGISGEHIRSMNKREIIAITTDSRSGSEPREIEQEDVDKIIEHTKEVPLPLDRQILHVIPQEFIVDNQPGTKNPIALSGRRLEARIHLTTYSTTIASNISRCVKGAGINVEGFVLQSLASSYSTLEEYEKQMGTVLLDIGSEVVDVIVYYDGGVHHTGVVGIGGSNITNDVAYLLKITTEKAEWIKCEYGWSKVSLTDKNSTFQIDGQWGHPPREITFETLANYIEPRMEEILIEAYNEARKADIPLSNILSVVITGGGSLIRGSEKLTEDIFNVPARIGYPMGFKSQSVKIDAELHSPIFASAIGILKFAIENRRNLSNQKRVTYTPLKRVWSIIKNINEKIL